MRNPENIAELRELDIDWIGMIFYSKSPRCVEQSLEQLSFNGLQRVGVFVDESLTSIRDKTFRYGLNIIQLHGSETPEICSQVKRLGVKVIKAISVSSKADLLNVSSFEGVIDYLLLDTKSDVKGGSGQKFDWSILESYTADIPFLISGGIGSEDTQAIAQIDHPKLAGVDLNSRFEISPGLKDVVLVKSFVEELRKESHEI
ncbi:MAG: phosphoribosylanthranilate isomerase [Cyclobacteriaceae bacterium]